MSQDVRTTIRLVKFDRSDLGRYADRLGAGKGTIEKDFVISTIFLLLAGDKQFAPFAEKIVFRGGTCIKKAYFPRETRFSEDLDFTSLTISEINSFHRVLEGFRGQDLGVTTITQVGKTYENSKGLDITVGYTSVLGQPNHIMLNLNTSATMRNAKRKRIDVMPYFPSFKPVIRVMDIREILAEKLRALLQRVKPRDVFDVWFLIGKKRMRIDRSMLREKLMQSYVATPAQKKESAAYYSHAKILSRMEEITEMAWKQELGGVLINSSPSRERIMAEVSETLKRTGDIRVAPGKVTD